MNKKKILVILSACIGIFLCLLDTTIMNVSLPAIQTELNVSLTSLSWALNIYTILFATLTIPLSRWAQKFGQNRFYIGALVVFMLGSLISASANSVTILIIGRAVQSIGAATMLPLAMTIGIQTASLAQRNTVMAALGVTQGFAAALGPVVGGIVTQFFTWRWIFLINIPLIIISIALCVFVLDLKAQPLRTRIDIGGSILSMVFLFTLTLALVKGREWGWSSPIIIILLGVASASFISFLLYERKCAMPMIDLSLFTDREFSASSVAMVFSNMFLVAVTVILPTYFTKIVGTSELKAALLITPISISVFVASPISALLIKHFGPRRPIFIGWILLTIGYYLLATINLRYLPMEILACLLVGIGFGFVVGPITVLSASDFTGDRLAASQSVIGVLREIGIVLAIAIYVSGLYGNINTAKANSQAYVTQQVSQLAVPTSAKKVLTTQIKTAITNEHAAKQAINVNNPAITAVLTRIHRHIEQQFDHAFAQLYWYSTPFVALAILSTWLFLDKKRFLSLANKV